jgi:hypothetical protein
MSRELGLDLKFRATGPDTEIAVSPMYSTFPSWKYEIQEIQSDNDVFSK